MEYGKRSHTQVMGDRGRRPSAGVRTRPHRGGTGTVAVPSPETALRDTNISQPDPPAVAADPLVEQIAALYAAEFSRFVRVAAAITGDVESARDVVQDAFARLLHSRAAHREDASLGGWAWRAVVNGAYSERRASTCAIRTAERLAALREPVSDDDTRDTALRALVRDLPERQRTIVFLRYYADLDYTTIAEALALSAGTVGAALNAARATLRTALPARPE